MLADLGKPSMQASWEDETYWSRLDRDSAASERKPMSDALIDIRAQNQAPLRCEKSNYRPPGVAGPPRVPVDARAGIRGSSMKILTVGNMYPPHHLGGYELAWQGSVQRMISAGHEVRVLTTDFEAPGRHGPDESHISRTLSWYWKDHDFPHLGPTDRLRLERHNRDVMSGHLSRWGPDVVCWWAMGGMSMAMLSLPSRAGVPSVAVVCDDWLLYGLEVDGWQRMARRISPFSWPLSVASGVPAIADPTGGTDRWVFLSETVRQRAEERWGLIRGQVEVAHPGVDPALFTAAPAREWGWRLLYAGRIDRRKGIDLAVEALTVLPRATLRIDGAGDDDHAAELRKLADDRGVSDRVEFCRSSRSELAGVYADADVVVFPVLWDEPWGLVPLEAMAVGRPVVATGRGGSGEYMVDRENCLLFDSDDGAGALAGAVNELAENLSLREALTSRGAETAARFPSGAFDRAVLNACEETSRTAAEQERAPASPVHPDAVSAGSSELIDAPDEPGLRRRAARGTVLNSAFLVGIGSLNLVRALVVAAFLTTAEFGIWSILFLTLALVGGAKAVMVSDRYIQQKEDDQERAFGKAFTLEVASALATMVVLVVLAPILALVYGEQQLLLPFLALSLMLPGLALQAPTWVFYRRLQFARQRTLQAIDPVISFIVTVALAAAGTGYWSLVIGTIAGAWGGGVVALYYSPYRPQWIWERAALRDYASFSAPLVVAMLAGMVMAQLSVFFGNLILGLSAVGAIGLASSFRAYTDRVDRVISMTLYPVVCRVTDRAEVMAEVFVKSNRLALMWGMPFGIGLALFADDFVRFVIGEQWEEAIVLLQVFGLSAALNQVGFNWTVFLRALGETRPIAIVTVLGVGAFVATAIPLMAVFELPGFAMGIAISTLTLLVARCFYLKRIFPTVGIFRHSLRAILPSLLPVGIVLGLRTVEAGERTGALAVAELSVYLIVTIAATIVLEHRLITEVLGYLRRKTIARPFPA